MKSTFLHLITNSRKKNMSQLSYHNPIAEVITENEIHQQTQPGQLSPGTLPPAYSAATRVMTPSLLVPSQPAIGHPMLPSYPLHYQFDPTTGRLYPILTPSTTAEPVRPSPPGNASMSNQPSSQQQNPSGQELAARDNNPNNDQMRVRVLPLSARLQNEYPLYYVIFHGILLALLGIFQIAADLLLVTKENQNWLYSFGGFRIIQQYK